METPLVQSLGASASVESFRSDVSMASTMKFGEDEVGVPTIFALLAEDADEFDREFQPVCSAVVVREMSPAPRVRCASPPAAQPSPSAGLDERAIMQRALQAAPYDGDGRSQQRSLAVALADRALVSSQKVIVC